MRDSSGAVIPGATVRLLDAAGTTAADDVTDASGAYVGIATRGGVSVPGWHRA